MPGVAVAVVGRSGVEDTHVAGIAEADSLFALASLTKPIVAIAALVAAEEGTIELDAPVGDHLPQYRDSARASITARHLLAHASGLPEIAKGVAPLDVQPVRPPATRRDLLERGLPRARRPDRGGVGHRLPSLRDRGGAAAAGHGCVPAAARRAVRPRARGAGAGPGGARGAAVQRPGVAAPRVGRRRLLRDGRGVRQGRAAAAGRRRAAALGRERPRSGVDPVARARGRPRVVPQAALPRLGARSERPRHRRPPLVRRCGVARHALALRRVRHADVGRSRGRPRAGVSRQPLHVLGLDDAARALGRPDRAGAGQRDPVCRVAALPALRRGARDRPLAARRNRCAALPGLRPCHLRQPRAHGQRPGHARRPAAADTPRPRAVRRLVGPAGRLRRAARDARSTRCAGSCSRRPVWR